MAKGSGTFRGVSRTACLKITILAEQRLLLTAISKLSPQKWLGIRKMGEHPGGRCPADLFFVWRNLEDLIVKGTPAPRFLAADKLAQRYVESVAGNLLTRC
jgi:hypothetical protein